MGKVLRLFATSSTEFDEHLPESAVLVTDLDINNPKNIRLFLMLPGAEPEIKQAFLLFNPFGPADRFVRVLSQALIRLEDKKPALIRTCTFNIPIHFVIEPMSNNTMYFSALSNFPGKLNNYYPVKEKSFFYDLENENQYNRLYQYLRKYRKSLIPEKNRRYRARQNVQNLHLDRLAQLEVWHEEVKVLKSLAGDPLEELTY